MTTPVGVSATSHVNANDNVYKNTPICNITQAKFNNFEYKVNKKCPRNWAKLAKNHYKFLLFFVFYEALFIGVFAPTIKLLIEVIMDPHFSSFINAFVLLKVGEKILSIFIFLRNL